MRNQLTHYELEELFRSLQDLLVLSLKPSLSFDFAEFLSRRLDDFERTLSVLSSRLRVSFSWSEVQLLSDLDTLLFIILSVNKVNIARTYLTSLWKNNFQPPEWVLCDQVFQAARGSIFQKICWKYFVMELDFAGLLSFLPSPRAKRNKISPRNVAFVA